MSWDPAFEAAFHPKVVAMVGISAKARMGTPGGSQFYHSYLEMGFPGKIYLVNSSASEILGQKAYPSVSAIPERVDLVIVTAPARAVPEILEDCVLAAARNVHVFTAGFEESGEEEGRQLSRQVQEISRRGRLNIIGPNSMGLYVPASRIGFMHPTSTIPGPVSFVFQSGGHSDWLANHGPGYGIYFNLGISYGNGAVMECPDFLEYLKADRQTRLVCLYLEGVRDGRRLFELIKEVSRQKPVILWKGGLTEAGSRAAASHTGSLMGQSGVWQAVFAQSGAVRVETLEEMAETAMTFLCLKPATGTRSAVLGMGGGVSVYAADACARAGLDTPALSHQTQNELKKFISPAGGSVRNPVDSGSVFVDVTLLARELELVAADPGIDLLIFMPHLNIARHAGPEQIEKLVAYLVDFARNNPWRKPLVVVFHSFLDEVWENELRASLKTEMAQKGVAVYSSLAGAVGALARFTRYRRFLAGQDRPSPVG
jgi:acyl-CoA synthetase (NDP forming)